MSKVIGYIRVSTDKQTTENQKLAILDYCNKENLKVSDWIKVSVSSRKSSKDRKLDQLTEQLDSGDTLIVSELSRLGRSVGQVATLVDALTKSGIKIISIKEDMVLNGNPNLQTKVMLTMFSLFAEIERDLISERTKEGLKRARAEGKLLGRPKGSLGKSKLDGKVAEIKDYMSKGVNLTNIAKIYGVSYGTMKHFVDTRGIKK